MDEASRLSLKRLIKSSDFDLDSLFGEIKKDIQAQLQSCENPAQAFQLKLKLDATDDLQLKLQNIADHESTV